ncbi:hypothetical protein HDU90_005044 [Geranomyces variabilis]|nr:hypothetical protein HDU90_005044 [Geranomyces variabilis]
MVNDNAPFTIFIRNGARHSFIVDKSMTIDNLLNDARRRLGGGGSRLVLNNQQLMSGRTVGDYPSLKEGSDVAYIQSCNGGE